MPRLQYALPEDVLRRFDPNVGPSELDSGEYIGGDGREVIASRLEGVESKWDRTAAPMRPVRVGSRDSPVIASARGKGLPVRVYLDHMNVLPFDESEGDFLERRVGRDNWTDMTGRRGSAWTIDNRVGVITIYRLPGAGSLPALRNYRDRFVRMSYRVGVGGESLRSGQTTLTEEMPDGATGTFAVDSASRLPPSGGTMLVGGEEYVSVGSVGADEIEVAERAVRRTSGAAHSAGDVVHFCPMMAREAVAAKAAKELVNFDNFTDEIRGGPMVSVEDKLDEWEEEWTQAVDQFDDT